jgi:hypothetical protein
VLHHARGRVIMHDEHGVCEDTPRVLYSVEHIATRLRAARHCHSDISSHPLETMDKEQRTHTHRDMKNIVADSTAAAL